MNKSQILASAPSMEFRRERLERERREAEAAKASPPSPSLLPGTTIGTPITYTPDWHGSEAYDLRFEPKPKRRRRARTSRTTRGEA
jgi:hypothetical protein